MYTDSIKTIKDAHQLKCPEYRITIIKDVTHQLVMDNRGFYYNIADYSSANANCITTECMAWVTLENGSTSKGYCSKCHRPD